MGKVGLWYYFCLKIQKSEDNMSPMKRIIKIVMVFSVLWNGCFAKNASDNKSIDIQQIIDGYVKDKSAVGLAIGYVDRGNIEFFFSGKSAVDQDTLISEETIFEIGSITKVFTSLAMMQQVKEGKISLDDPIEKYIPEIKVPEKNGKKITFRHLATHTSGLPCLPTNFSPADETDPYKDYDLVKLSEFLKCYELTKDPGEEYEYSNLGMVLLGHVLSAIDKKNYQEMIKDRVFKSLGLRNTYVSFKDADLSKMAQGHHLFKKIKHWDMSISSPAGSICSNIEDMSLFLAANMNFINSILCDLLHECHLKQFNIPENSFGLIGVGLGWHINHSNKGEIVWHNGGTGGFSSFIGFIPDTQRGIIILSNCKGESSAEEDLTEIDPTRLGLHILDENYYILNSFESSKE